MDIEHECRNKVIEILSKILDIKKDDKDDKDDKVVKKPTKKATKNKEPIVDNAVLDDTLAKEIEQSIYDFCINYGETNDTPMFLIQSIYETKSNDIINEITNSNSTYLLSGIKSGKIKSSSVAYLKPEEINPDKYENITKKREMEEYKKNNKTGSSVFTCSKCKKSNCSITQNQTRAGDEPPTTFVECLECSHVFKFS